MNLSYLDLTTTSPSFNLAVEQYVFDALPRDRAYLMLWQNDNAIIIGKHQNTLAEINEPFVREHGIHVVRRLSGGGAVYHDLGNLNFTFIADAAHAKTLDLRLFCQPVLRALAALGVQAELNGRNDMTINGQKFSGNSQYMRDHRVMHHGTILFDSNLNIVDQALHVDPSKIQSKGCKSVRSRVGNVRDHLSQDISLPEFRSILLKQILQENSGSPYQLTQEDLRSIVQLQQTRYDTWDWNYGTSPPCSILKRRRFPDCGLVEIYLLVEHGTISQIHFRGDFFSARDPEELAHRFIGHRPEPTAYHEILQGQDVSSYFLGLSSQQLFDLLTE